MGRRKKRATMGVTASGAKSVCRKLVPMGGTKPKLEESLITRLAPSPLQVMDQYLSRTDICNSIYLLLLSWVGNESNVVQITPDLDPGESSMALRRVDFVESAKIT